jgi:hypothetical protein
MPVSRSRELTLTGALLKSRHGDELVLDRLLKPRPEICGVE